MEILSSITLEFVLQLLGWLAFGVLVGVLSAALGIGGGVVMVPTFRLIGGMEPIVSSGTSLFVIVPTSIAGVWRHIKAGTCHVRVGLLIGLAGACTSVLGTRVAGISPGWTIMLVAALVIVYSAYNMFQKGLKKPAKAKGAKAASASSSASSTVYDAGEGAEKDAFVASPSASSSSASSASSVSSVTKSNVFSARHIVVAILIGLAAGFLSGYVGVGGGFIIVPLLCSFLGMDMKHAAGTSLLAVLCLATPAAISQAVSGNVNFVVACEVIVGAVFGAILGQKIASRLPDRTLRLFFGVLLAISAVVLVINEFV